MYVCICMYVYLTLLTTEEKRKKEGISKFCPSRICKGKKPTITGCGSYTERGRRWLFHYKATTAMEDPQMVRKIIFYAVGLALKVTLKNHVCRFNNKIFKQMKGEAIGVGISGDVANVFMIWWDRKMNSLCAQQNIMLKLYSRYVDDTNLVLKGIDGDEHQNQDERTMTGLQQIANSNPA